MTSVLSTFRTDPFEGERVPVSGGTSGIGLQSSGGLDVRDRAAVRAFDRLDVLVDAAAIERKTAVRRWGATEDIVGTALFSCSPAAAYVTGADLPVDGGCAVSGL